MTDHPDAHRRALELLAQLGDTPDQIAANLTKLGIKGARQRSCACPIFNYLAKAGVPLIGVDSEMVAYPDSVSRDMLWLPEPVGQFVYRFDQGDYRALEATNA